MKKSTKRWIYPLLIIMGMLLMLTNGCEEEDSTTSKEESTSGNPIQNNSTVINALSQAGITTYNGSTPPSLEGVYSTTPMKTYNATGKLTFLIGQNMTTICKFYNQTSAGRIYFAEQISPNLFADGKGCYITGSGQNFTIWMENSLSNGAATAFVLTGTLDQSTGNFLNCKSLTVYTIASASYNVGDWYAASGWMEADAGQKTGDGIFYTSQDFGCGPVKVSVGGSLAGSITVYYTSGTPECGATGCVTITKDPGSYGFTAECGSYTWHGTITIVKGQCTKYHLTGKDKQLKNI
jgi:hypothetical protein